MKWLKKKIRQWLADDDDPSSKINFKLDVLIQGKITTVIVFSAIGFYLQCRTAKGSIYLIEESQAIDKKHFWALWKYFGGGLSKDAVWGSDGAKVNLDI